MCDGVRAQLSVVGSLSPQWSSGLCRKGFHSLSHPTGPHFTNQETILLRVLVTLKSFGQGQDAALGKQAGGGKGGIQEGSSRGWGSERAAISEQRMSTGQVVVSTVKCND